MGYIGPSPNPGQNREVDDISSSFNGSLADFTLQVNSQNVSPGSANAIIVSLGGVVQNPGTDYTVAASTLTFTTAPASGLSFFGLVLGQSIDTEGTSDGSIVNASVSGSAAIAGTKISPDFGSQNIVTTGSISGAAGTFTSDLDISSDIRHIGDTDTKIRFPAADTVTVQTGGSERTRVDSAGRLLVGKSATKQSDGENTAITQIESTGHCMVDIAANGTNSSNHYAALNLIRSDGTSVNSHTAVDNGDIIGRLQWIGADGSDRFNSCAAIFASAAADFTANDCPARLHFSTNAGGATPSERLRIYETGVVQVMSERLTMGTSIISGGATSGNFCIEFSSATGNAIKLRDTHNAGSTNYMMLVAGSSIVGSITGTTGAASFNNLSDYRSKENDVKITDGITKLKLLRPIRFNYKTDSSTLCDGFFAHEVTPAVPTAVTGEKDAVDSEGKISPQMLDSSKLVPLLTAALQEAIAKIETLETKVAALEAA